MFRKISLGITLFLSLLVTASALTLETLQQQLNHPVIVADFTQTRALKGMKKPIISSGNFIVSAQNGLYWAQTAPFQLTMILTNDKLKQQVENGKPEVLTAKNNPQIFQFNRLLSSLFTMNAADLNDYFNVGLREKNQYWTLTLQPKKEPINKIFVNIVIKGQQYINEVTLYDQQGDITSIQFKNHQALDALSNEDIQKFK